MLEFQNDGLGYEPKVTPQEAMANLRRLRPDVTCPEALSFDSLCDIGLYPPAIDPGQSQDEAAEAAAWQRLARIMN